MEPSSLRVMSLLIRRANGSEALDVTTWKARHAER